MISVRVSGIERDVNSSNQHALAASEHAYIMPISLPTKMFHEVPLFLVLYGQLELLKGPV